jgi:hypothetical protein
LQHSSKVPRQSLNVIPHRQLLLLAQQQALSGKQLAVQQHTVAARRLRPGWKGLCALATGTIPGQLCIQDCARFMTWPMPRRAAASSATHASLPRQRQVGRCCCCELAADNERHVEQTAQRRRCEAVPQAACTLRPAQTQRQLACFEERHPIRPGLPRPEEAPEVAHVQGPCHAAATRHAAACAACYCQSDKVHCPHLCAM